MAFKRILPVILILLLLSLPTRAAETQSEDSLIRDILIYYSHHQAAAETDLIRLLEQLEEVNPEVAGDWRHILRLWDQVVREEGDVPASLPDDLPQDDSLCIIVMGYQLSYSGGMEPELILRLELALESARKYPNAYILCTGGGTAPGSNATEADQMVYWLEQQGIAPERLIRENRSISTEENALFSLNILREDYPQVSSLALISSNYHIRRCRLLFESVLYLKDLEQQCQVAAFAGCDIDFPGFGEGFFEEAENLGKIVGQQVRNTQAPKLSTLTALDVQGDSVCPSGEYPDLRIFAHYDSGYCRDVTHKVDFSGLDPEVPGTRQISLCYTENGITLEATAEITILPPETTAPTEPTETILPPTEPIPETQAPPEHTEVPEPSPAPLIISCILCFLLAAVFALIPRYRGKYTRRRR